jgi:hypothetical protein
MDSIRGRPKSVSEKYVELSSTFYGREIDQKGRYSVGIKDSRCSDVVFA